MTVCIECVCVCACVCVCDMWDRWQQFQYDNVIKLAGRLGECIFDAIESIYRRSMKSRCLRMFACDNPQPSTRMNFFFFWTGFFWDNIRKTCLGSLIGLTTDFYLFITTIKPLQFITYNIMSAIAIIIDCSSNWWSHLKVIAVNQSCRKRAGKKTHLSKISIA